MSDSEVKKVLEDNPQNHKEAGFSKGWASRFDTWFKIAKELGFVYYKNGEKIRFSRGGEDIFEQNVESMQVEHKKVDSADKGDVVGLKVNEAVREGADVYKIG